MTWKRTVAVGLAGLTLSFATPAAAQDGHNMWGGRIVERTQFYWHAGYPEVEAGARLPFRGLIEIAPRVRFGFAQGTQVGPLSLSPGVDFRLGFFQRGNVQLAAAASIPLHVSFAETTGLGIGLIHPGVLFTYSVGNLLDIDAGLQFRDDLYFTEDGTAFVGVLPLIVAVEGNIGEGIQLGFRIEGGPEFGARGQILGDEDDASVEPWFQAVFGMGFAI